MDVNIGRDGKIQMSIIDNHLIELYESGVLEERIRILTTLRQLIQEKDSANDEVAVRVIDWVIDRLLGS